MSILNKLFLSVLILLPTLVEAKILDKIEAVINTKIITSSEITRIIKTIGARKELAGLIYKNNIKYTKESIVNLLFQNFIISDKLSALGYIVSDDRVESKIQTIEKSNGVSREEFTRYLNSKNLSFPEYFELIRSSLEFNIFIGQIIHPLISITDQEIKNQYFKEKRNIKTLTFKYDLIDYSIDKVNDLRDFGKATKNYHNTGIIDAKYSTISKYNLDKLSEEDLNSTLKRLLKKTNQGDFTEAVFYNGSNHVFYIKKKDTNESKEYTQSKFKIRNVIFEKKALKVYKAWIERQLGDYYTKKMI
jgi:peptidyl-prolyl cis-trans isomerase SurA